jgi:hypothetical protein
MHVSDQGRKAYEEEGEEMKYVRVSDKYFRASHICGHEEVKAKPVKLKSLEGDFFIFYEKRVNRWRVCEGITGASFPACDSAMSAREAIKLAEKEAEDVKGIFLKSMDRIIRENGISPRYEKQKRGNK